MSFDVSEWFYKLVIFSYWPSVFVEQWAWGQFRFAKHHNAQNTAKQIFFFCVIQKVVIYSFLHFDFCIQWFCSRVDQDRCTDKVFRKTIISELEFFYT